MAWVWYSVKTLFRLEAHGEPEYKTRGYDPNVTLAEERVVLFRARNEDEALKKAEDEARAYCDRVDFTSVLGQRVKARYLDTCELYELLADPGAGVEIYSATEIVSRGKTDAALVNARFGQDETEVLHGKRINFMDRELARAMMEEAEKEERHTQEKTTPAKKTAGRKKAK
ncbi:MAG: DUF4288 domain-containing protein [Blastocatellia bacterium]